MKILVTGGNGFIASYYIRRMEELGHDCISYDLPVYDILDEEMFSVKIQGCDMVAHFAAMADVNECIKEQDKNFDVNVKGTYVVGKMCAAFNIPLIFISTCCVYGNSLDEIEKEWVTAPMCSEPYAVSKVAGEYILRGIPDLKYVFIRVGTVHGEGAREALFTTKCLVHLAEGKKIYIDGDGLQTRQLIYINDLVDGICLATVKFDSVYPAIFNLCGYEKISAMDTMRMAEKVTGIKADWEYRKQRYGQTFEENISIQNAYELLGWEPVVGFEEGMRNAWSKDKRFEKHINNKS